jgi:dephospho-CoA kinase
MLHLALTGNIASGKSTVAELFQSWGAVIIDADQIVRELQQPGSPVLGAIATRFGSDVILPDGQLDRGKVRQIVMRDPEARADLNAIVHPEVHRRRAELLES